MKIPKKIIKIIRRKRSKSNNRYQIYALVRFAVAITEIVIATVGIAFSVVVIDVADVYITFLITVGVVTFAKIGD